MSDQTTKPTDFSIDSEDNRVNINLDLSKAILEPVLRKGVATGETRIKFKHSLKASEADKSFTYRGQNGKVVNHKSVAVTIVNTDPKVLAAKKDAKFRENFLRNLRIWTFLNKGTKEKPHIVAQKDVVTMEDLNRWYDTRDLPEGEVFLIKGHSFHEVVNNESSTTKYLTIMKNLQAAKEKALAKDHPGMMELLLRAAQGGEPLTEEQIAAAQAAIEATKAAADNAERLKAGRAKLVKSQENLAKASEAEAVVEPEAVEEVELTEQGQD